MKQNPEDEFVNVTEPRNRFRQAGNKSPGSLKGLQVRALSLTIYTSRRNHYGESVRAMLW